MISLAGRDILHSWGKFLFTSLGLGLLVGVTLVMAGVYRGMVSDGKALLDNSGADLWVVQQGTLGPYAESSSLADDIYQCISALPGVVAAANITYLTMQVQSQQSEVRAMVVGIAQGASTSPGWPTHLLAGRQITRGHYEAVADVATGFKLGERIRIRRNHYQIVGLTKRMVSSSGDPMIFVPLKDAQEAQFLKDNDAIWQNRARIGQQASDDAQVEQALLGAQDDNKYVNAVLVRVQEAWQAQGVAESIRQWQRLTVYSREQMEGILIGKLIATSAKQIGMFLAILSLVSAATVAFIIYTLTMDKIREIAVLKLIGTKNRTIAVMILQQALALGLLAFVVGKIAATFAAPLFPKYVLLIPQDSVAGFAVVLLISALASLVSIRVALRVDPAEAIGG